MDAPDDDERGGYSAGLRAVALVLPAFLLALLIAFRYIVLDDVLSRLEAAVVTIVIGVAGVAAFSMAIFARLSELHASERRQRARLEVAARDLDARGRRLEALNEAGIALAAELDTDALLQKVAELARQLANARYAALGVFGDEGELSQFFTAGITQEQRERIGPLPKGRGILGLLQAEGRPLRLRDLKQHPASVAFPPHHPAMNSFLGVPILLRGEPLGNLYLTEKVGAEEFSDEDERALVTLAAQAAIAIENARLYEQSERVTILEERQRIGMDLHDGAMQSLYGVGLLLEDAAAQVDDRPPDAKRAIARAVDRLNATIADLRSYVIGLSPIRESDRPLREALPALAHQVAANALLHVSVDVDPRAEEALDRSQREAMFFIAHDALANVARHARARNVALRLVRRDATVALEIADDGVGFDPADRVGGLGLRNMRERAFLVGGSLGVESAPGRGAQVRFEVPARREVTA
ncbi:MAG TPA: GAF domain-containing sensor histidine kinase [Candidatus Limnocylindria bacterium]|nr:GAF domain-containing sensor histidine kinase [Candidatus Limnocylindria bacterium]